MRKEITETDMVSQVVGAMVSLILIAELIRILEDYGKNKEYPIFNIRM